MLIFPRVIVFFVLGLFVTAPASAHHKGSFVPADGKITCSSIKCHIQQKKENRAEYFTDEIYYNEHAFWGCRHNSSGEHVWTEMACITDCSLILDIRTCSESCAFIAHDIVSMNIDIDKRICN